MLPLPLGFDDKPRTPLWCQENGSIPEAAVCGLASPGDVGNRFADKLRLVRAKVNCPWLFVQFVFGQGLQV